MASQGGVGEKGITRERGNEGTRAKSMYPGNSQVNRQADRQAGTGEYSCTAVLMYRLYLRTTRKVARYLLDLWY